MWPEIALAVAQVGVGAVSSIWNYSEGQRNLGRARNRLKASHDFALEQIDQQFTQGKRQNAQANGADAASLAARGITGEGADLGLAANAGDRADLLTLWKTNATKTLEMDYQDKLDGLNGQTDQAGMDLLTGLLGTGLSAAGTLVDAGAFSGMFQSSPGAPAVDYGNPSGNSANLWDVNRQRKGRKGAFGL